MERISIAISTINVGTARARMFKCEVERDRRLVRRIDLAANIVILLLL